MVNFEDRHIKDFLDGVDEVLNSNTFIFEFAINSSPKDSLSEFLRSESFREQFFLNDLKRGWYNFHLSQWDSIGKKIQYSPKPWKLLREPLQLKFTAPKVEKNKYLIAMLMADKAVGTFFSPYGHCKTHDEATKLVDSFLTALADNSPSNLTVIEPDFMYAKEDREADTIPYFQCNGSSGLFSDTATVITFDRKSYLLLTNGSD